MASCGGTSLKFSELRIAHGVSEQKQVGKYSSNKYPPTIHMYDENSEGMTLTGQLTGNISLINMVKNTEDAVDLLMEGKLSTIELFELKVKYSTGDIGYSDVTGDDGINNGKDELTLSGTLSDIYKTDVTVFTTGSEEMTLNGNLINIEIAKVVVRQVGEDNITLSGNLLDIKLI